MSTVREYPTERIRNVAILGHGGAGKTALADGLCYVAGATPRRGAPDRGQAVTMTTPEESEHGISMQVTPAWLEWMDTKVNLLDTPGYLDFSAEALAAVRVADAAIVTVNAIGGVQVGTEKAWQYCDERRLPRILFISMMDRDNADFEKAYQEIKEHIFPSVVPVEVPIGQGSDFRGIVNLFSGRAHLFGPDSDKGDYDEADIPPEMVDAVGGWTTELMESLATTDETLLERYLEGGTIARDEAIQAMARAMARGDLVPVFCGSAATGGGLQALLRKIVELFPHPGERPPEVATSDEGETVSVPSDDAGPFVALVFKTASEPKAGEISYLRVVSGAARTGMEVARAAGGSRQRLGHLAVARGKERAPVGTLHAGDIGAVTKLRDVHTNDTLCNPSPPLSLEGIPFPEPDIAMAIRGRNRSDDDKLGDVLHRLMEEDPSFRAEHDAELGQTIVRGQGELHLEVQVERMQRRYQVEVETEPPRIPYRETFTKPAKADARFKKQTGGRGQFGQCSLRIRPLERGEGYRFIDSIKGGVIPAKWVPSVDHGVREAAAAGVLAGYPVVDFGAECYDGQYHSVDSSDVAFQVAGSMAFKKAAAEAGPVLLEPMMDVEVVAPEDCVGDIVGDVSGRRGQVHGMDTQGRRSVVRARIPQSELYRYATALRSLSQGRAHHTQTFAGYEPVPDSVAQRIIQEVPAQVE